MDNNNIVRLDWDSNFFGLNVFVIESDDESVIEHGLNLIKENGEAFVYVNSNIIIRDSIINDFKGRFVGTKVIFNKVITERQRSGLIEEFNYELVPNDIMNLAIQSGEFSRFNIDERLPQGSFEKLYSKWLEKAIGNNSIRTFVYRKGSLIQGFISLELKPKKAVIGLFGVDTNVRGVGIGSLLLEEAEIFAFERGYKELFIPTQKENVLACNFYRKHSYNIVEENKNYHFKI